jgi:hypothetical protein
VEGHHGGNTPSPGGGVADDLTWLISVSDSTFAASAVTGQSQDEVVHGVGSTHVHGAQVGGKGGEVREHHLMR